MKTLLLTGLFVCAGLQAAVVAAEENPPGYLKNLAEEADSALGE